MQALMANRRVRQRWFRIVLLGWAFAVPGAEPAEMLEGIYAEHNLQPTLPVHEAPSRSSDEPVRWSGMPWLLPALGLIVVIAWLARVDFRRLAERLSKARRASAGAGGAGAAPSRRRDPFHNGDELARQGRYAEAIHALLLGVLAAVGNGARRWPAAATAREIATKHVRSEDLEALVAAAEVAHFGGRAASAQDYAVCRSQAGRVGHEALPATAPRPVQAPRNPANPPESPGG